MSHSMRKTGLAALVATALAGLPASPAAADYTTGTTPATTMTTVFAGDGRQNDPHVSGSLVSYTSLVSETSPSEIRYHDLATGVHGAIRNEGHYDHLSAVSGSVIVFRRGWVTDGRFTGRDIMAFDTAKPTSPPVVLDPREEGVRRAFPAIGASTVAWMEYVAGTSTESEVVVYDLDTGVATPLTADGNVANLFPAVSADGSVVTWTRCSNGNSADCDIYRAVRIGTPGAPPRS